MTSSLKRIVIEHRGCQFAGLYQIVGALDVTDLTTFTESVELSVGTMGRHVAPVSLVTVTPRYALYREGILAPGGRFNEFHPDQQ